MDLVRCVDWGNIQRSPTFEAIFNWTASEMQLPIKFDSAGIMVERIMKNFTPIPKQKDILEAGKSYGLEYGIPSNDEDITKLYAEFKDKIHARMMEFRNRALKEAGVPEEFIPGMRVPFKHTDDLKLIIPIDKVVIPKLEEYYSSLNVQMPKTVLYGDLVGKEQLVDELVGKMDLARKQVEYFLETRYKAIDKIREML